MKRLQTKMIIARILLRQHLGIALSHSFLHKNSCAILDDEGPAHDLYTDIEELGNDPLAVIVDAQDALQRGQRVYVVILIGIVGHVGAPDDDEHQGNDSTYN